MNFSTGRVCLSVLLVCACLTEAVAQARGRVLPVDEMTQKAQVIAVGTVQSITPRVVTEVNMVGTEFSLSLSEVWKGEALPGIVLLKPGGKVGDQTLSLPGHEYLMKVGEQVVIFAVPYKYGNYNAIGIRQGLYRVGQGPDHPLFRVSEFPEAAGKTSTLTLQDLKDQVWLALGRPVEPRTIPPPQPPTPPSKEGAAPSEPSKSPAASTLPAQAPAPASGPEGQSWAGWGILILLFVVATGVIISKRKSAGRN